MTFDDDVLWWMMVGTAIVAAALSFVAAFLDRRATADRKVRFSVHMLSYIVLTISVLIFVLRGLLAPT
jgi:hypothetical protein